MRRKGGCASVRPFPGHTHRRPQAAYEQVGDVPNVVFPTAALVDRERDRVSVYYGAADTVVCLAHGHLSELVDAARA